MRLTWEQYGDAMRLVPGDNAREHWAKKAKRLKVQKETAKLLTGCEIVKSSGCCVAVQRFATSDVARATVTITRIGKRKMDSDNLASSAKGIRDGIAQALGVDDGDERYTWLYAQETGKVYGVRVEVHFE